MVFRDLKAAGYSTFTALKAAIETVSISLTTFLGVAAGIATVVGLIAIIDKLTVSFEEASKAADDAAAAYDEAKADLDYSSLCAVSSEEQKALRSGISFSTTSHVIVLSTVPYRWATIFRISLICRHGT